MRNRTSRGGSGRVFIVIPAYNEASVIEATVRSLLEDGYSVVVVDDASTDSTRRVVAGVGGAHLVSHPINLGQGAAIQTGMQCACMAGASTIVHFDADGQHERRQIPDLVRPIAEGRADIVFGSRFLRASDLKQVPPAKRLILRVGRVVSALLTGVWLSDTHNGFRALGPAAIAAVQLQERGFAHATEILDIVRRAGLRYIEVPTTIRYTDYSRAKGQNPMNALNIVMDLLLRKLFS